MEICINGEKGGITLETEKTAGDVLAGLEGWLRNSGHRLSGLRIDGELVSAAGLTDIFDRDLADIGSMDILTSSWAELAAQALTTLYQDLEDFEKAGFEERGRFISAWLESPSALFLAEDLHDIYNGVTASFKGTGQSPAEIRLLIAERLRELENPERELRKLKPLIDAIVLRLEDLPLDFQTGKDQKAAETIQIFSAAAEKLFRIYGILRAEGFDAASRMVEDVPLNAYVEEFFSALKELLAAYEAKDAVLAGDIAEYELAPRLGKLYSSMLGD